MKCRRCVRANHCSTFRFLLAGTGSTMGVRGLAREEYCTVLVTTCRTLTVRVPPGVGGSRSACQSRGDLALYGEIRDVALIGDRTELGEYGD